MEGGKNMVEPIRRIFARTLFDGRADTALSDRMIEIAKGRILSVEPAGTLPGHALVADIVAPGFIDLQINGANDVQFNDTPTVEGLAQIAEGARKGGSAHILPTFVTAPGQDFLRAIDAAKQAILNGVPGILGLHLEGPFLSPERPGVHDPKAIRPLTDADVQALTTPFPGPLLVTLAPECQPPGAVKALVKAGVIVFAGHSQASADQIAQAQTQGLSGVTHLFNAMSQMMGREPGVVGRTLASDSLYAGIIADGHHVAWDNIRIATRAMPDRLCLVTDAMQTLAGRSRSFSLHDEPVHLSGGRLTTANGTLAGAHIAMDEALRNILHHQIAPPALALRMAATNPARVLGLGHDLGIVAPGARASLTLMDAEYRTQAVIVDGVAA